MPTDPQPPPALGIGDSRSQIWNLPVWLATGSFVGLIPFMPGTFGTLLGIPLVYGLAHITSLWLQGILIGLLWCCGVPLCTVAATRLGARDPGAVVLDEILALPVAYFGVELHSPAVLVAGFLLFRLFDVVKPPPARQLERLPRGLGIMADDLVAALYALLSLRLLALAGVL